MISLRPHAELIDWKSKFGYRRKSNCFFSKIWHPALGLVLRGRPGQSDVSGPGPRCLMEGMRSVLRECEVGMGVHS